MEPVSFGLKIAFLAVLWLFLLWVSRSALRDLRQTTSARRDPVAVEATGVHQAAVASGRTGPPLLVVERAPGHQAGSRYDVAEGAILGRGDVEVVLEDAFASSQHARIVPQGGVMVLEDLGSTNGTYLNDELLRGPQPLHPGDQIRIGDSRFVFSA
jgi:pSer/pThr/pTyr-binding forkhead associated (FHA) protein